MRVANWIRVDLPVSPPVAPMLARLAHVVPADRGYLYEPKWDGFRCLVFRDRGSLLLQSRNEKPLDRYFPELVAGLPPELPARCVLDGEIVVAGAAGLDFDALLQRIHPAASRVETLARRTPAAFVAFDLLALGDDDLRGVPQRERRARLEAALEGARPPLYLTPATRDPAVAADWFRRFEGAGLDGVVARPDDAAYAAGQRTLVKIKHERTADCVVGGYRVHKDGRGVGSLLLGLHDREGRLHHVGVASGMRAADRRALLAELAPLALPGDASHPWRDAGSEVRTPGGPSRWSGDRELAYAAVAPERVCEVRYDHLQGPRFRHATRFLRWRPDRDPASCTYDQLEVAPPAELASIFVTL